LREPNLAAPWVCQVLVDVLHGGLVVQLWVARGVPGVPVGKWGRVTLGTDGGP
jgi:hypothetical protein